MIWLWTDLFDSLCVWILLFHEISSKETKRRSKEDLIENSVKSSSVGAVREKKKLGNGTVKMMKGDRHTQSSRT